MTAMEPFGHKSVPVGFKFQSEAVICDIFLAVFMSLVGPDSVKAERERCYIQMLAHKKGVISDLELNSRAS